MKITLSDSALKQEGILPEEALAALLVKSGCNIHEIYNKMVAEEKLVRTNPSGNYLIPAAFNDKLERALWNGDNDIPERNVVEEIVLKMAQFFPKGKKEGTSNAMWRGNRRDLTDRLQKFFKLYGVYSEEELLKATEKYVQSFNGDYQRMRILKYFILKNDRKMDEEGMVVTERISDLASILENLDDEDERNDWETEMR